MDRYRLLNSIFSASRERTDGPRKRGGRRSHVSSRTHATLSSIPAKIPEFTQKKTGWMEDGGFKFSWAVVTF